MVAGRMKAREREGGMRGELVDATVVSKETQEAIERSAGLRIDDVDPELVKFVVDQARKAGNDCFKKKEYKKAVEMYCQAVAGAPHDFTLFGNRSAAYLALGRPSDAVLDASKSIVLSKDQGDCGRNAAQESKRSGLTPMTSSASIFISLKPRLARREAVGEGVLPPRMRVGGSGEVRAGHRGVQGGPRAGAWER